VSATTAADHSNPVAQECVVLGFGDFAGTAISENPAALNVEAFERKFLYDKVKTPGVKTHK
jgi:hypothetical protein